MTHIRSRLQRSSNLASTFSSMPKGTKKNPNQEVHQDDDQKIPKSMVFKSGKVGKSVQGLVHDLRQTMLPFTAERLQESKHNRLKDFLDVAGLLGVTHLISLSQSEVATNMRMLRTPRGPTLTFRVQSYSLMKDVIALQRRPHSPGVEFKHPPLVVLNNFGGKESHKQLMAVMFQNLFPPINMQSIKLSECRRVVLFTLDSETEEVDMRHYVINATPVQVTKSIKKAFVKGKIPDLHKYQDISEYFLGANDNLSDSEVEDTPDSRVTLPQDFVGRGNREKQTSALRLQELGPRLRLKLLKIEEQVCDGRVLYHAFESKTEEEAEELQAIKAKKQAEKEARRKAQEANLAKKTKSTKKRGDKNADDGDNDNQDGDEDDDDDENEMENRQDVDDDEDEDIDEDADVDQGDDDDEFDDGDDNDDESDKDDNDDEEEQPSSKKSKVGSKAQFKSKPSINPSSKPSSSNNPNLKHKPVSSASSSTQSSTFKFVKKPQSGKK